ncbi:MAG: hypothetical protein ACTSVL_02170, partial [Promethearchaeota archaeon]
NKRQRAMGFIFLGVYLGIAIFYLLFDGWHYEWIHYGYAGKNQNFDLNLFGDMNATLTNNGWIYNSTNNLHNFVYICFWIGIVSSLALITGNKWLRQASIGTVAFPIISAFSTINPYVASDIFTWKIFYYHSYILQIIYDLNHLSGIIMGSYLFYITAKEKEKISFKQITPMILFTWVLFYLARIFLQKWPFWAPGNDVGFIGTNQINSMPFTFYGLEYLIVVAILYFINFINKLLRNHIKNPKIATIAMVLFFATLTIILIMSGLVVLQVIPWQAFIQ